MASVKTKCCLSRNHSLRFTNLCHVMLKFTIVLVAAVLLLATAAQSQEWNDLRARFGLNPITNFIQLPRTVGDAIKKGFRKRSSCDGAANGYVGERFSHENGDTSLMLLFDKNGIIAGIQTQSPKSSGYPTAANKKYHDSWIEERTANVLTAYFVEPKTICTTGRTAAQLSSQGTGTGLYLQLGRSTSNTAIRFERVPMTESAISSTQWTKGKCFAFMGQHYWYNMRMDMDCNDFRPYFMLYNNGKLDAFGFAMAQNLEGEFFEHPTVSIANQFFPFVPKCMYESNFPQTLTTVHIYFYKRPWTNVCL